jgi:hypothetical protein
MDAYQSMMVMRQQRMKASTMSKFLQWGLVMKPFMETIDSVGLILADIMPTRGRRLRKKVKGRLNFILWILVILFVCDKGRLQWWDVEIK